MKVPFSLPSELLFLNNGSRLDYFIYAILTNLSYFRKKEGREREREKKRGKAVRNKGGKSFYFVLKEFWSSNCHTEDNYFQYCVFKDRPIHDFQTYISSSIGYINLLLGVFDRFSLCLQEVTRVVFTNMVFLVQIQFVDTENI